MSPESTSINKLETEYWAFISYRHLDNQQAGRQWANWLHQKLESYEVPDDLVGQINYLGEVIPDRIYPVFRDEEDLPADGDLSSAIRSAVERSKFMIVLCTPRSAESKFVAEEIAYFKQLGGENRILAVLIEGEPNASWDESKQKEGFSPFQECFPFPLMHPVTPEGVVDVSVRAEPIAADFRIHPAGQQGWTTPAAYREALQNQGTIKTKAIVKIVENYESRLTHGCHKILAGVLGVPLRILTRKDERFQLQKARLRARQLSVWLTLTVGLTVLSLIAAGVALEQKRLTEKQRQIAISRETDARKGVNLLLVMLHQNHRKFTSAGLATFHRDFQDISNVYFRQTYGEDFDRRAADLRRLIDIATEMNRSDLVEDKILDLVLIMEDLVARNPEKIGAWRNLVLSLSSLEAINSDEGPTSLAHHFPRCMELTDGMFRRSQQDHGERDVKEQLRVGRDLLQFFFDSGIVDKRGSELVESIDNAFANRSNPSGAK